ncbi:alpha-ketoglutarate decarboxylase [Spongiimicrobium salis]|uniref:alpha-ketoglutarate decarboxylase n=1 Tax=Spongiimicrobium salis TaxID=1667022 RepID=UPI00374CF49B
MKKNDSFTIKKAFFVLFFVAIPFIGSAQNDTNAFWKNVRFGGGLGLGFGNDTFNGVLAPSGIYEFNQQVAVGLGLSVNYAKFAEDRLLAYGGNLLSLYNPLPFLQLSEEFEQLRIQRRLATFAGDITDNYWSPALFLGVGYTNRNVTFGLRYNVLHEEGRSIYADSIVPFVRLYF